MEAVLLGLHNAGMRHDPHQVGTAPPRGRPRIDRDQAERQLSELAGTDIRLPERAVVSGGPTTCPACGSNQVTWAVVAAEGTKVHPLIWHATERLADSFVCGACDAGWIEPDDPQPITWVRPWWLAPAADA
jgi:hypothetical protein